MQIVNNFYAELQKINDSVFEPLQLSIIEFEKEKESQNYNASKFKINNKTIFYRLAKKTPKKTGQFVTIWKRNKEGVTKAYNEFDYFDYLIIAVEKESNFGFFIFPKLILLKNTILATDNIVGKRGIRVYPSWELAINKQAQKTQKWQAEYFVEIAEYKIDFAKFEFIFSP